MSAWSLPTTATVDGKETPIRSDFRAVLDALAALDDLDLTMPERAAACVRILYPEWKDIQDWDGAFKAAIDLVIDRTETDVLLGNSKGIYQAEDLNRVGQAVEELAALLPQLDLQTAVAPKTDWAPPEAYDPDKWIRTANMAVYLENVTTLLSTMGILAPADFPVDMNFLTYRGANAIEKALLQVHDRICGIQNAYQYSGAAYAGEETGL